MFHHVIDQDVIIYAACEEVQKQSAEEADAYFYWKKPRL